MGNRRSHPHSTRRGSHPNTGIMARKRNQGTRQMERHTRKTSKNHETMEPTIPVSSRPSNDCENLSGITSTIPNDGQRNLNEEPTDNGEKHKKIHLERKKRATILEESNRSRSRMRHKRLKPKNQIRIDQGGLAKKMVVARTRQARLGRSSKRTSLSEHTPKTKDREKLS